MKYTLANKTEKEYTKDGVTKQYTVADLTDEQGIKYEKVGAFRGEFAADIWYGELTKNDKGYWNLVTPRQTASAGFKTLQTEKLMEKKEQSISKFQDNKELSIRISSTMNKAVDCAIAEYTHDKDSLYTLEEAILKWREWLWKHWEDIDSYSPF